MCYFSKTLLAAIGLTLCAPSADAEVLGHMSDTAPLVKVSVIEPGKPFDIPVTDVRFEVKYPWMTWGEVGVTHDGRTSFNGLVDQAVRFYEDKSKQVETFVSVKGATGTMSDDKLTPAIGVRVNFKVDEARNWSDYGTFTVGIRAEREMNYSSGINDNRVMLYGTWSLGGKW